MMSLLFTLCSYFVSVIRGNNLGNRTFFLFDFHSLNYLFNISLNYNYFRYKDRRIRLAGLYYLEGEG